MNELHDNFVMSVQTMQSRYNVFGVLGEWIEHLRLATDLEQSYNVELSESLHNEIQNTLRKEYDTWTLIMQLYYFRLSEAESETNGMNVDMESGEIDSVNEGPAMRHFMETDRGMKEVGIVLEWLQGIYSRQSEPDVTEKFINWEQTLDTLKTDKLLGINSETKPMISEMDPDACYRQGKEVHPLDAEEEAKVQKGVFYYVRSGEIDKAIVFLYESGHIAKAASMSGYQYTEKVLMDPNDETGAFETEMERDFELTSNVQVQDDSSPQQGKQGFEISGNAERDMWKNIAFSVCETNGLSKYERASLGALCGHRQAMLDAAGSWEDRLWAYLKSIYDVKLETELRRRSNASLIPMPEDYWAQDISIAECVKSVELLDTDSSFNLNRIFYLVQKSVIVDDVEGLLPTLKQSLIQIINSGDTSVLTGHVLRFLTHMMLAFGIVGLPFDEDLMNLCTEAYIKVLVNADKFIYIPFYIDKLTTSRQIPAITEQINPELETKRDVVEFFLKAAQINSLPVLEIGIAVVEKLRTEQEDFDIEGLFWITCCYNLMEEPAEVMLAYLRYTLLIARKHLILGNIPKAKQLMREINQTCIGEVVAISDEYEDTLVRECLCYKSYLDAEEALSQWQKALSQRPKAERLHLDDLSSNLLTVADKALLEKKRLEAKSVESRWTNAVEHHLKSCIEKFLAVLKFPEGWLIDCVSPRNEEEFSHVKAVRRILLPKIVFILLKLVIEQNTLEGLRQFLYVISEDHRQILNDFSVDELGNIFNTIEQAVRAKSSSLNQLPK